MTTTFDIDEIERLLAAATPGEWAVGDDCGMPFPEITLAGSPFELASFTAGEDPDENMANTSLIVTLHNSAPAMIAELRELRAENARLREMTATNKQAWDNALEFGLIPERHRNTVQIMSDGCRAALGEPK